MKYFISDLIVGMKHFAEFADWIESNRDPDLGIEFTAFTHDEAYWQALAAKVPLDLSWVACEHRGGLEHRIRRECMAYGKL